MAKKSHKRLPRRGAHGQFLKGNPVRRRRAVRVAAPRRRYARRQAAANPPRRRRSYRHNAYFMNPRRRRSYRSNPGLAIMSGGGIMGVRFTDILYAGVGFVAPSAINGFISGLLPTALTGNAAGRYAVKGGIVFGLSWAGKKFLGPEAGKYIAIGGLTYIVANLIIDFAPQLFSGFGYMNPGRTFQPMRGQPYLGMYQAAGLNPTRLPERVDPNARF